MVFVGPAVSASRPSSASRHDRDPARRTTLSLADVLAWARPQQLPIVVFPGCGHFFQGRLAQLQRVITGMWQR
jgi:alpha/beta superfamily hydrolase